MINLDDDFLTMDSANEDEGERERERERESER